MFRQATSRAPDAGEITELMSVYKAYLATYTRDVKAARELINVGESKPSANLNAGQLAAWTMVANLIFNLDEVLNKS